MERRKAVIQLLVLQIVWYLSEAAPYSLTIDCGLNSNKPRDASLCACLQRALPPAAALGAPRGTLGAPRGTLGAPGVPRATDTSAERLERLQQGMQRLAHAVDVMDHLDRYLTDRTAIVFGKLASMMYNDP